MINQEQNVIFGTPNHANTVTDLMFRSLAAVHVQSKSE